VPAVKIEKLTDQGIVGEESSSIRKRVQKARDIQRKRLAKTNLTCNAEMQTSQVKEFCPLDQSSLNLLRQAVSQMNLSARGFYRVIKVARTIADLAQEEKISVAHLAEALQYRLRHQDV